VSGSKSFGGVARNAAEVLARLGAAACLASVVGEDEPGEALAQEARSAGIDVSLLKFVAHSRTGEYVAIFHGSDLFAAFADMEVLDKLDCSFVEEAVNGAGEIDGILADCNITLPGLQKLKSHCQAERLPLAVDTVSVAKAARVGRELEGISLFFGNRQEAQALTGEGEPQEAILALRRRGATAAVISDGAAGVFAGDDLGTMHMAMPETRLVNVSGAGDALAAGTFMRRLEGAGFREALIFGLGCAHAALEWSDARPSGFDRAEAERRSELIAGGGPC
jgi:pseudouridine kinase